MSAKCKICGAPIDSYMTVCASLLVADGTDDLSAIDCAEFAIAVVEAARAVVALFWYDAKARPEDMSETYHAVMKLREALAE